MNHKKIILWGTISFLICLLLGYVFFLKEKINIIKNMHQHSSDLPLMQHKDMPIQSQQKSPEISEILSFILHAAYQSHVMLEIIEPTTSPSGASVPVHVVFQGNFLQFMQWVELLSAYTVPIFFSDVTMHADAHALLRVDAHLQIFLMTPKEHQPYFLPKFTDPFVSHAPLRWDENHQKISLDLEEAPLTDALQLVSSAMHHNVLLGSGITGTVTLHLNHADPKAVFDVLLMSHDLVCSTGDVWFVEPRSTQELPLITKILPIHYAKASEIAKMIQDDREHALLSKRGQMHADDRTHVIYVEDIPDRIATIASFIATMDKPVHQVLIEARLASVDAHSERDLGIHFGGPDKEIALGTLLHPALVDVKLSALENTGHAEIISSPSLFTADQQEATIESGEEIPYQEVSKSGATSVAFKKAVLSLKVTPHVMPNHRVMLELQVNQDRPSNRIVLGVPAIDTRQMNTTVWVKDGETIVLGGIYENDIEQHHQAVPGLIQVPLLGFLFGQQNKTMNKRELLIFVTPKILS